MVSNKGDATASWTSDRICAILFPTAETLDFIEKNIKDDRLILIINPQWNKGGSNFVSDFGWGRKKEEREKLLDSFNTA